MSDFDFYYKIMQLALVMSAIPLGALAFRMVLRVASSIIHKQEYGKIYFYEWQAAGGAILLALIPVLAFSQRLNDGTVQYLKIDAEKMGQLLPLLSMPLLYAFIWIYIASVSQRWSLCGFAALGMLTISILITGLEAIHVV